MKVFVSADVRLGMNNINKIEKRIILVRKDFINVTPFMNP